ncbi:S8 family serine peptidase, partial [Amycolatopsis mediterranei]
VKAGYSSYGLGVIDVTAPGGETGDCVLSAVPGGYAPLCGTSMAAPHVTGVLALLASAAPEARPRQLRRTLEAEALPMPCPADYDLTGDGLQDAYCAGYEGYNGFYGHGMVQVPARAAVPDGRPDQAR